MLRNPRVRHLNSGRNDGTPSRTIKTPGIPRRLEWIESTGRRTPSACRHGARQCDHTSNLGSERNC